MDSYNEFLTEQEKAELRREMESLAMGNERRLEESRETESEAFLESQTSDDIVEVAGSNPSGIERNGSYIKTSNDNMTAWMYLAVPEEGREKYTMEELVGFLQKKGITTGYHRSNLAAMIKKRVYEREILVAQGQPAIEGNDGYFEYKFDANQHRAPKILEDGRVDYTNMSSLQNVRKGDVVAVYHHAKEGQDGYNVKGKALKARKVKEIPPIKGQVECSEDNPNIYLAQKDGKIELKNGKIDIQAVHEIQGDLTLITGKVEFYGDIVITGNVEAGVVIRAGRNIEIKGSVEAVSLFAGGDIILSRGIQGGKRAKVSAKGNVFADFIEHTVMMAGGNVQANIIMNSTIMSDGQVILTGKKGAIVGGYTHAMMGIKATDVGNPVEVRTIVHVGCEKEVYQKMSAARTAETALEDELKEIIDELRELRQRRKAANGKIPKRMEDRLKVLEPRANELKKEVEENRRVRIEMENLIAQGQGSQIVVNGNIYRGTVVSVGQLQIPIERSTCLMKYFHQNGMIESSVIAYS